METKDKILEEAYLDSDVRAAAVVVQSFPFAMKRTNDQMAPVMSLV